MSHLYHYAGHPNFLLYYKLKNVYYNKFEIKTVGNQQLTYN